MRTRVWIALLVAALGWGSGGVASRVALDEGFDPIVMSGGRAAMAVLFVAAYQFIRRRPLPLDGAHWRIGLVLGTTNLAIPFVLLTIAVKYASAGFVGLLVANLAIGTAAWGHLMLPDERLHVRKLAGLGLAVTGVLVLVASGDSGLSEGGRPLLAVTLTLVGVCFASFGVVFAKRLAGSVDAAQLSLPQFAIGAILIALIVPFTEGIPREATTYGWVLIAFLGLAATALPFLMFYWALQHVSATIASLVAYLVPLVSLVLGITLIDEQLTGWIAVGGALILAGIVITDRVETAHRARLAVAPIAATADLHSRPNPTTDRA